jgi:transcription antitermination protein NusB
MGHRRRAREAAIQIWYQIDQGGFPVESAERNYWAVHSVPDDIREFADALVNGVAEKQEAIDGLISEHSAHWRLSRMAAVDRNILRVAIYELLHCGDVPIRVTLNEAIEIGKRFGTEESGAFINGILDQVAKGVDKPES